MKRLYLVKYNGNYADEFNVYFHLIMDEDELQKAKEVIKKVDWTEKEFYFGTNESIDVSSVELLEALNHVVEITPEQHQILIDLGINEISFGDGLNWDGILEAAYEWIDE